jgi:hypothetical protein
MSLETRAKRYALVIKLLYRRQGLAGSLADASRGARFLSFGVRLNNPLQLDAALKLDEPLALACGVKNVLSQRRGGLVAYQVELGHQYWQYFTRQDLPAGQAVGLAEARRPVNFGFEPPHSLIAGTTGSGKTETLKSVLVSLLTTHTPPELGLILLDPHRELSDFANAAHLLLPIATEPGEIDAALAFVNGELARRKAANDKAGPLIVLAVDEAASDELLQNPANVVVLQNVSQQARKYRLHLILATQKPGHSSLPKILDNLLNRWVGQLSDAGLSARVTGQAGLGAHKLTGNGDFLHLAGPVVERLQIAQATRPDFERLERGPVQQAEAVGTSRPDIVELPASATGRPPAQVEPVILAHYWHYGPDNISRQQAEAMFSLKRTGHNLHRDFCREFGLAWLKLRRSEGK